MRHRQEQFYIYRRHLPHFRSKGRVYFVTWCLKHRREDLTPDERDLVVAALKHFDGVRYRLYAYVVMNDHVHVIVQPVELVNLEAIMHSWKSFTAHELVRMFGRRGAVWQHESYDRIVRNEREFHQKMKYIQNNPRKRWPEITSYRWVWCLGMEEK